MLVLASASPRRRELLTQAGYHFEVHPSDLAEDRLAGEDPVAYVTRLAGQKAAHVYRQLTTVGSQQLLVVLGADTTVSVDSHILGKPSDAADAARMLRLLSGRMHRVATGVALVSPAGMLSAAEITEVHVRSLTEAEIEAYVATGEPFDKAGAYAIQGRFARWIPRIEGCYFNVVGLPIARVASLLDELQAKLGKPLEDGDGTGIFPEPSHPHPPETR